MTNWLEQLKGESQAKLLQLLRRSTQTITSLAEALGLSDNAIRTHISALERDGLIRSSGTQRDTGGKPARLYTLTTEGEELFPKAYAFVLGELVEEIARQDGPSRALALLHAVGQRAAAGADPAATVEERVEAAAAVLRRLGGDIIAERRNDGWYVQGFGCPLSAVAAKHPEVCALAKALVEEITGESVTECCDRSGRPRCGFRVAS